MFRVTLFVSALLFLNSCIFHSVKNSGSSSNKTTALAPSKALLKPECKYTLIVEDCYKRSKIEIFVEGFGETIIDVSNICIYGVAAIDVHYRITAVLPRPKITVICALPES